jgi:EAL and modified HD-GYP domain-containing signal transduction protein
VAKLLDASCDVAEIEGIVATDPAMAHQLLELAGIGAASGTRRKVRTLREAVVLAGVARMRSWASLLLLIERGSGSEEQMTTALVRARMCELLVALRDRSAAPFAFTAGMVSAFDLLLGARLEEILASLPIAHDLRNAAVGDLSPVGRVVSDVIDYQLGVRPIAPRSGFDDWVVHAAWTQAMSWAVATSSAARPAA